MIYSQIRTCQKCGQDNRVSAKHLAHKGRCGKCKEILPAISEAIELDSMSFEDTIRELHVPTMVYFYVPSAYGVPGQVGIYELAKKLSGDAVFVRVDVMKNHELVERLGVRQAPFFRLYKHGEVFFEGGEGLTGRRIIDVIQSSMILH